MKADFGCVLKHWGGLLRGGLAGLGRLWGAGKGSRQGSTRVLGWVLARSVGLGDVLWALGRGKESESSPGRGLGVVWGGSWGGSWRGLWGLGGVLGALWMVLRWVLKGLGAPLALYRKCIKHNRFFNGF